MASWGQTVLRRGLGLCRKGHMNVGAACPTQMVSPFNGGLVSRPERGGGVPAAARRTLSTENHVPGEEDVSGDSEESGEPKEEGDADGAEEDEEERYISDSDDDPDVRDEEGLFNMKVLQDMEDFHRRIGLVEKLSRTHFVKPCQKRRILASQKARNAKMRTIRDMALWTCYLEDRGVPIPRMKKRS